MGAEALSSRRHHLVDATVLLLVVWSLGHWNASTAFAASPDWPGVTDAHHRGWRVDVVVEGVDAVLVKSPGPDEPENDAICRGGGVDVIAIDPPATADLSAFCARLEYDPPNLTPPEIEVTPRSGHIDVVLGGHALKVTADPGPRRHVCEGGGLFLVAEGPLPVGLEREAEHLCTRLGKGRLALESTDSSWQARAWPWVKRTLTATLWWPLAVTLVFLALAIRHGQAAPGDKRAPTDRQRIVLVTLVATTCAVAARLLAWPSCITTDEIANLGPGTYVGELLSIETPVNPPLVRALARWVWPFDPITGGRIVSVLSAAACVFFGIRLAARRAPRAPIAWACIGLVLALDPALLEHGVWWRAYAPWVAVAIWHADSTDLVSGGNHTAPALISWTASCLLLPWTHHIAWAALLVEAVLMVGLRQLPIRLGLIGYGGSLLGALPVTAVVAFRPTHMFKPLQDSTATSFRDLLLATHDQIPYVPQSLVPWSTEALAWIILALVAAGIGYSYRIAPALAVQLMALTIATITAWLLGFNVRAPVGLPWFALATIVVGIVGARGSAPLWRFVAVGGLAWWAATTPPVDRTRRTRAEVCLAQQSFFTVDGLRAKGVLPTTVSFSPPAWTRRAYAASQRLDLLPRALDIPQEVQDGWVWAPVDGPPERGVWVHPTAVARPSQCTQLDEGQGISVDVCGPPKR